MSGVDNLASTVAPSLQDIQRITNSVAAQTRGQFEPPKVLPNPIPNAQQVEQQPEAEQAPEPNATEFVQFDDQIEVPPAPEVPQEESEQQTPAEEEIPEDPKSENFKRLRDIAAKNKERVKAAQEEVERLRAELTEKAQKLEQFETGLTIPDVLAEREAELERLRPLEKIHALKTSKHYQETFVKPLADLRGKLHALAKDYDMEDGQIDEALSLQGTANLNRYLLQHFDELGAQDARGLILKIQDIHTRAAEAEREPNAALTRVLEESQALEMQAAQESRKHVQTQARVGWVDALAQHKEDGRLHELIYDSTDKSHNEKLVYPVLTQAGTEYGKLIKALADNGLKTLPKELAKTLAYNVQCAQAANVQAALRVSATKRAEAAITSAQNSRVYTRPAVGGGSVPMATPSPVQERLTPESAAQRSREAAMRAAK